MVFTGTKWKQKPSNILPIRYHSITKGNLDGFMHETLSKSCSDWLKFKPFTFKLHHLFESVVHNMELPIGTKSDAW